MKNFTIILITSCLLSGCIPFLSLFPSWGWLAADGASYITTGKSTTDHAISIVADEDCALFRFVKGEKICHKSNKQLADIMYSMNCEDFMFDDIGNPYCRSK